MNGILKSLLASALVQKLINNQIATIAGVVGLWVVQHHAAAGYTQNDIVGALVCLGAVGVQVGENHFRAPKPTTATPVPTSAQGVKA